jgi:hypothetical protein
MSSIGLDCFKYRSRSAANLAVRLAERQENLMLSCSALATILFKQSKGAINERTRFTDQRW